MEPTSLSWIVNSPAAERAKHLAPALAARAFDNSRTFMTTKHRQPLAEPGAVRTESFASETALQRAVTHERLAAGTRAVVFDDEAWPRTPVAEQRDPAKYYRLAGDVAHTHSLELIAAPATDLARILDPAGRRGRRSTAFLRLGLAAAGARFADVYDIQAQGAEGNLAEYVRLVREAARQARDANPHIKVLAGLSTNPGGRRQPASVLADAVDATRGTVSGYWLNDPRGGKACPSCAGPFPDVVIAFLHRLLVAR